jgi:phospholipid/cholesterol/gamma-HCH transport system ATP-binding protein
MKKPIISVHNLVNHFGDQVVHNGLNLDINSGEIFGIVGGSGSGKSVLLRSILGLHKPDSGEIIMRNHHMNELSEIASRSLHRHWGVMYQNGALFSNLTVLENVEMPLREYLKLPDDVIRELAIVKLSLVGLSENALDKFPSELSGGMVKRAGLARALVLDPPLLFLDEPTAGLDPIAAAAFDTLILGLRKRLGLTVVMITHDLDTLFGTCDRIGVLVNQRMLQGTPREIMQEKDPWVQAYFGGPRARHALANIS